MPRLRGLLLDVGGTLVPNAFAVSDQTYARLKAERLREEFGVELPWLQPLVAHRFSSGAIDPDTLRQDVEGEVVRVVRDHDHRWPTEYEREKAILTDPVGGSMAGRDQFERRS